MSVFVDIEKKLGDFRLKVKFSAENEILSLLGASGCGKSMTLKCIAGIEKPDAGKIVLDGVTLFDSEKRINLSPQARRTGILFQNYALFPNMTVMENIRAGARREKDTHRRELLTGEIVDSFGLRELVDRYPHELSGGQQQRVALARILVSGPNLLLLDEPFSALDRHLRFRMEQEVSEILRRFGKTVIFVSHDRDEVYRLSQKIAVMKEGSIDVIGDKKEVFTQPQTVNAAILTGCRNIAKIRWTEKNTVYAEDWDMPLKVSEGEGEYLGIRDDAISLSAGEENGFRCRVISAVENPFTYTLSLKPIAAAEKAVPISYELDKALWRKIAAAEMNICMDPEKIILLKG